jgi:hypothetical protein
MKKYIMLLILLSAQVKSQEVNSTTSMPAAEKESALKCNIYMGPLAFVVDSNDKKKYETASFKKSETDAWEARLKEKGYNLIYEEDRYARSQPGTFTLGSDENLLQALPNRWNDYRCNQSSPLGFSTDCILPFTLRVNTAPLPANDFSVDRIHKAERKLEINKRLRLSERYGFSNSLRNIPSYDGITSLGLQSRIINIDKSFFSIPSPQDIRLKQIEMLPTCVKAKEMADRAESIKSDFVQIRELVKICYDKKAVVDEGTFDFYNVTLRESVAQKMIQSELNMEKYRLNQGESNVDKTLSSYKLDEQTYYQTAYNKSDLYELLKKCPVLKNRN